MSNFKKVFRYYNQPLRGFLYMPARWLIVPFNQLENLTPKSGLVVDVGCGEGVMATLLALTSKKRTVIGIDSNINKIQLAKKSTSQIKNLKFESIDVFKKHFKKVDGFVLSDFLHHVHKKHHEKLLKHLASSLKSSGVLLIKEIDTEEGLRSTISRFFDFIFYPKEKVYFVSSKKLKKFLESLGLKVKIVKSKKWFPGSTNIFICRK